MFVSNCFLIFVQRFLTRSGVSTNSLIRCMSGTQPEPPMTCCMAIQQTRFVRHHGDHSLQMVESPANVCYGRVLHSPAPFVSRCFDVVNLV